MLEIFYLIHTVHMIWHSQVTYRLDFYYIHLFQPNKNIVYPYPHIHLEKKINQLPNQFWKKGMIDYYTKGKYVNYLNVLCGGDIWKVYQRELLRVKLQRELLH